MPEVQRNRALGAEMMKITVVGALAIVAVVIVAVLLISHLNKRNSQEPAQDSI